MPSLLLVYPVSPTSGPNCTHTSRADQYSRHSDSSKPTETRPSYYWRWWPLPFPPRRELFLYQLVRIVKKKSSSYKHISRNVRNNSLPLIPGPLKTPYGSRYCPSWCLFLFFCFYFLHPALSASSPNSSNNYCKKFPTKWWDEPVHLEELASSGHRGA